MHKPEQLGFSFDSSIDEPTADVPNTIDAAIPYYRNLISEHHAAMMKADEAEVMKIRAEAYRLARRLNNDEPGILAPQGPGAVMERVTTAEPGVVPLWGQAGSFVIAILDMRMRIDLDGMFGIGSATSAYPGFSVRAIDYDKPFLSETGYRSFLGVHAELVANLTPDLFAKQVISSYIQNECKGKARRIIQSYVEREKCRGNDSALENQR